MILAQKFSTLISKLAIHRRATALLLTLPCFGVVAAFGIAPDTMIDKVKVNQVVEELRLPSLTPLNQSDAPFVREERIQRGDTVASLLERLQVEDAAALQLLRTDRGTHALYQLVPGRTVRAVLTDDGKLQSLQYLNDNELFAVDRDASGFKISEGPAELEARTTLKSGVINNSLFGATDAAGIPDAIAIQMADIFSGDIDFNRDLRKGDRFSIVYETYYHHGEPIRTGHVLAAEFINEGKKYQAVYFEYASKQSGYYSFDGKSLRKQFLRSPLAFSRITSGYTTMRFHPILKLWRAHRGIDFGAPTGTPVRATADGTVDFAGKQGGYGNLIILRHQSKYTTYYGHMSKFAAGLHKGSRVSQGQTIGYVGMTGLATGPHLHYEFRINGEYQNPLRIALPAAPPIDSNQKARFQAFVQPLAEQLDLLRTTNLASID